MRVMDVKWRRMEKGWDMIISLHFSDDKDNQLYHHISDFPVHFIAIGLLSIYKSYFLMISTEQQCI